MTVSLLLSQVTQSPATLKTCSHPTAVRAQIPLTGKTCCQTTNRNTSSCEGTEGLTTGPAFGSREIKSAPSTVFLTIDHTNDLFCWDEAWQQTSGGCTRPQCVRLPCSSHPRRNVVCSTDTPLPLNSAGSGDRGPSPLGRTFQ